MRPNDRLVQQICSDVEIVDWDLIVEKAEARTDKKLDNTPTSTNGTEEG